MPRKPQPWFRFYVETMSDRKIRRFAPAERWVWAGALAAARESPVPGQLLISEGEPMDLADLADYADVPKKIAAVAVEKMRRFDMLHDENGVMVVTNFGNRQFESDNVTARTRTHRERSNEQGRNVPTSAVGTDVGTTPSRARATETETETEQKTSSSVARKRATRLDDGWTPNLHLIAWQREAGISDLLARRELDKFRDYWRSVGGDRGRRLDWDATWRNWLRTAHEREPGAGKPRPSTPWAGS